MSYKRRWQGLDILPPDWEDWKNVELDGLEQEWDEQRTGLEKGDAYKEFLARLRRQWAIETGVIEKLYSVSEDATKTLIEKGLDASVLGHDEVPSKSILTIIKDQHEAIESLYEFVKGDRQLTTSYVRELHFILTQHQDTYDAVSSAGQELSKPLRKGAWKNEPNGIPGEIEFCPPLSVDAEMVSLCKLHTQYETEGIPPEILGAWLHHRFILIHPFSDGNGRVARCLATLVFLKARRFPLVVTRVDKPSYISALRTADEGDLSALVKMFGSLQAKAIREAFSLTEEMQAGAFAVKDILSRVTHKWGTFRRSNKDQVAAIADALLEQTRGRILKLSQDITAQISEWGEAFKATCAFAARSSPRAHWFAHQINQSATEFHYFADRQFHQSWASLQLITQNRVKLLFSFHGMGRATGTVACLALLLIHDSESASESSVSQVRPICDAPFTFTYKQEVEDVIKRFNVWFDECIVRGLDDWRKLEGA